MSREHQSSQARLLVARDLRAIFFDFDGVLLESAAIKDAAFRELFADLPQHHEQILSHHQENLGRSRFEKFEWIYTTLLGRKLEELDSVALGHRFAKLVRDQMLDCSYVPGALELLESLGGRIDCFVVSGTPQRELTELLEARQLTKYFREALGSPTPKPMAFRILLDRYELSPRQVLAIGDGVSDYEAASSVGIPFVARISEAARQDWSLFPVPSVRSLDELRKPLGRTLDRCRT